jgi:hypothetical protein
MALDKAAVAAKAAVEASAEDMAAAGPVARNRAAFGADTLAEADPSAQNKAVFEAAPAVAEELVEELVAEVVKA